MANYFQLKSCNFPEINVSQLFSSVLQIEVNILLILTVFDHSYPFNTLTSAKHSHHDLDRGYFAVF